MRTSLSDGKVRCYMRVGFRKDLNENEVEDVDLRIEESERTKGMKYIEESIDQEEPRSYAEAKRQMERLFESAEQVHFIDIRPPKVEFHDVESISQIPKDAIHLRTVSVYDKQIVLQGLSRSNDSLSDVFVLERLQYTKSGSFMHTDFLIYVKYRTVDDINDEIAQLQQRLSDGIGGFYIGKELVTHELSSEEREEMKSRISSLEMARDYSLPKKKA